MIIASSQTTTPSGFGDGAWITITASVGKVSLQLRVFFHMKSVFRYLLSTKLFRFTPFCFTIFLILFAFSFLICFICLFF
jgi:hypothetical protein